MIDREPAAPEGLTSQLFPYVFFLCLLCLGRCAAWLRRHVTPAIDAQVRRELVYNAQLQRLRTPLLTAAVDTSAATVSIEFFVLALPPLCWAGYHEAVWLMVIYMTSSLYLGDWLKVCPPRLRLSGRSRSIALWHALQLAHCAADSLCTE